MKELTKINEHINEWMIQTNESNNTEKVNRTTNRPKLMNEQMIMTE